MGVNMEVNMEVKMDEPRSYRDNRFLPKVKREAAKAVLQFRSLC
jgi:hypothetical protein